MFQGIVSTYLLIDYLGRAHFNPAVTFATIVTRKTSLVKGLLYMVAQLSAAIIAMLLLVFAFPQAAKDAQGDGPSIPQELVVVPAATASWLQAFIMEILLTFILVYVIFATAFDTVSPQPTVQMVDDNGVKTAKKGPKNLTIYTASGSSKAGFAPLSIGLTLGFLCFLGGSVSGGAFNPARVFGAGFCAGNYKEHWASMWIYFGGDFIGAALAGLVQQNFFATKHPQPQQATGSSQKHAVV